LIDELVEPAAFNALHSMELAAKAALIYKTGDEYKTHNIGGEFGKYFKEQIGVKTCRKLNKQLMKYGRLRYPGQDINPEETREILEFTREFLKTVEKHVKEKT